MSSDNMRLVLAIVPDADREPIVNALLENSFHVTGIASTGGFLRRGKATLLIGVEKEKVKDAIQLMRENSAPDIDPELKRAVIFVLRVDYFDQI